MVESDKFPHAVTIGIEYTAPGSYAVIALAFWRWCSQHIGTQDVKWTSRWVSTKTGDTRMIFCFVDIEDAVRLHLTHA